MNSETEAAHILEVNNTPADDGNSSHSESGIVIQQQIQNNVDNVANYINAITNDNKIVINNEYNATSPKQCSDHVDITINEEKKFFVENIPCVDDNEVASSASLFEPPLAFHDDLHLTNPSKMKEDFSLWERANRAILSRLPVVTWLPSYKREWLMGDVAAGLTISAGYNSINSIFSYYWCVITCIWLAMCFYFVINLSILRNSTSFNCWCIIYCSNHGRICFGILCRASRL